MGSKMPDWWADFRKSRYKLSAPPFFKPELKHMGETRYIIGLWVVPDGPLLLGQFSQNCPWSGLFAYHGWTTCTSMFTMQNKNLGGEILHGVPVHPNYVCYLCPVSNVWCLCLDLSMFWSMYNFVLDIILIFFYLSYFSLYAHFCP